MVQDIVGNVSHMHTGQNRIWRNGNEFLRLYPDGVPLNKMAISCSRVLYRENKLARFSKSSYARFQSQKTALMAHL